MKTIVLTMAEPQTLRTPSCEELVVLTRADYDALVAHAEDEDDVAIYDARRAELADGQATVLPAAISAALLRGDRRIKAVRRWRGLSQIDLAAAIGIRQSHLSDIENGRRACTAAMAGKLATALDVSALWLAD